MSKLWKVATLVAMIAVPLLLASKRREIPQNTAPGSNDDNIFELELRG
jgi:hypothetical protein